MAVSIGSVLALSAPAVQAAVDETLGFSAGSVRVVDTGPGSDTVRFTMNVTAPATTRLFVDIKGKGEGYITLGSPTALGVPHAVYNTVSTPGCQVYTGTTFGEADAIPTTDGTIVFDIRKDELAPTIQLLMEDSAGGAADCKGFDGVSNGRPISFAANGGQRITSLDWVAPANPTNLTAVGTPGAITLFWTPPAGAVGVRYQVIEDGVANPVSESVSGNAATFSDLAPGSVHTYHLRAYRFWGERLFATAGFTPGATAAASAFPTPAAGAAGPTVGAQAVRGATTKNATRKASARAFTPSGFRVRATHGRVRIALPELAKGQKIEIQRSAATRKAKFARVATSKARSYTDRTVRRRHTYRYRLILVGRDGSRSLPSAILEVRVR